MASIGRELQQIEMLDFELPTDVFTFVSTSPISVVEKIQYKNNSVSINKKGDKFINIPETLWTAYVGGYQPLQKWLQDRKGRQLTPECITEYQKIAFALHTRETIINEIDLTIRL